MPCARAYKTVLHLYRPGCHFSELLSFCQCDWTVKPNATKLEDSPFCGWLGYISNSSGWTVYLVIILYLIGVVYVQVRATSLSALRISQKLRVLMEVAGADLEFLKGGFFSLLISRPHPKPHLFLLFLSKKGGFLWVFRTIENPPGSAYEVGTVIASIFISAAVLWKPLYDKQYGLDESYCMLKTIPCNEPTTRSFNTTSLVT